MANTPEILRLRVLLCFLREDREVCTVMEIARTLGEEHYTVSRVIAGLEKEGLVSRRVPRKPCLTDKGREAARSYAERITTSVNHLLYEGVNLDSAKNDAFYWALYNSDDTMRVIRDAEEKCRIKYELREQKQFGGALLCRRLRDGDYRFPFIIYREHSKNGNNISMANEGFEHPCVLSVKNGQGILQLKAVEITANSAATGLSMHGRIKSLKYFDNGRYISAEENGSIISLPASALIFRNIGEGMGQILHGLVCLQIRCSVGAIHMPESTAILTVLI